jgi:hypothetical protein
MKKMLYFVTFVIISSIYHAANFELKFEGQKAKS